MTELLSGSGTAPDTIDDLDAPADVTQTAAPVLITEQQVLFATAAAVPAAPAKTARRWSDFARAIGNTVRSVLVTSTAPSRPKPRHYPSRNYFLEDSRMAREMLRL